MAERVRIEHTSARKRADDGFEDRGDHQAPITLRKLHNNARVPLASGNRQVSARRKPESLGAILVESKSQLRYA